MSTTRHKPLQLVLAGLGLFFVGLGLAGIVLPLLPTTPFLLLAAFCFARGSERFHRWLLNHRILGPYIRDYLEHRGLRPRTKAIAIALVTLTIGASIILIDMHDYLLAFLLIIAISVVTYLLSLRTLS